MRINPEGKTDKLNSQEKISFEKDAFTITADGKEALRLMASRAERESGRALPLGDSPIKKDEILKDLLTRGGKNITMETVSDSALRLKIHKMPGVELATKDITQIGRNTYAAFKTIENDAKTKPDLVKTIVDKDGKKSYQITNVGKVYYANPDKQPIIAAQLKAINNLKSLGILNSKEKSIGRYFPDGKIGLGENWDLFKKIKKDEIKTKTTPAEEIGQVRKKEKPKETVKREQLKKALEFTERYVIGFKDGKPRIDSERIKADLEGKRGVFAEKKTKEPNILNGKNDLAVSIKTLIKLGALAGEKREDVKKHIAQALSSTNEATQKELKRLGVDEKQIGKMVDSVYADKDAGKRIIVSQKEIDTTNKTLDLKLDKVPELSGANIASAIKGLVNNLMADADKEKQKNQAKEVAKVKALGEKKMEVKYDRTTDEGRKAERRAYEEEKAEAEKKRGMGR
mgnify:CR=1 FL=1